VRGWHSIALVGIPVLSFSSIIGLLRPHKGTPCDRLFVVRCDTSDAVWIDRRLM
jgi:hypothetical protein